MKPSTRANPANLPRSSVCPNLRHSGSRRRSLSRANFSEYDNLGSFFDLRAIRPPLLRYRVFKREKNHAPAPANFCPRRGLRADQALFGMERFENPVVEPE